MNDCHINDPCLPNSTGDLLATRSWTLRRTASRVAISAMVLCLAVRAVHMVADLPGTYTALSLTSRCGVGASCFAQSNIASGSWRRTVQGWEPAASLDLNETTADKAVATSSPRRDWLYRFHCCVLPIALAMFMTCLGCWSLTELPNHAV